MSGILTQDSISLTESLDGVRFSYLATSSWKTETIKTEDHNTKHRLAHNKRAQLLFFSLTELWKTDTEVEVLGIQML